MLWRENLEFMPNSEMQFNYNRISLSLNDLTEEMAEVIAPTDSRFRGDMRMFEDGDPNSADDIKAKIEQL